jgi:hypothetical protein
LSYRWQSSAEGNERLGCHVVVGFFAYADQRQQDVLGADVPVAECEGLTQ